MPEMNSNAEDSMEGYVGPGRKQMPTDREGLTHRVTIGGMQGYITANPQEDGTLGEIFIHGFGQLGSTNAGWTNAFAIMVSIGLQYGVELPMLARKFAHMKFDPMGETDNPDIPHCQSIPDYIFKWIALHYGDEKLQEELRKIDEELGR
jgi:ribonucleoside-diphosphate reductase alpha chain